MKVYNFLVPLIVCLFLSACAAPKATLPRPKPQRNFRVSVFTNGTEVKDYNTALVHRVLVSQKDFAAVKRQWPQQFHLPFSGISISDRHGDVMGVRVIAGRSASATRRLGLQDGDLITAVGKKHTRVFDDLKTLVSELSRTKQCSLTFERNGKPHKILYTLSSAKR